MLRRRNKCLWRCGQCHYLTRARTAYIKHIGEQHPLSTLQCHICFRRYGAHQYLALETHISRHARDGGEVLVEEEVVKEDAYSFVEDSADENDDENAQDEDASAHEHSLHERSPSPLPAWPVQERNYVNVEPAQTADERLARISRDA
jgi:hypothetical protein